MGAPPFVNIGRTRPGLRITYKLQQAVLLIVLWVLFPAMAGIPIQVADDASMHKI